MVERWFCELTGTIPVAKSFDGGSFLWLCRPPYSRRRERMTKSRRLGFACLIHQLRPTRRLHRITFTTRLYRASKTCGRPCAFGI